MIQHLLLTLVKKMVNKDVKDLSVEIMIKVKDIKVNVIKMVVILTLIEWVTKHFSALDQDLKLILRNLLQLSLNSLLVMEPLKVILQKLKDFMFKMVKKLKMQKLQLVE